VGDFFAGGFGVVDGDLGGLIGAFADVLGGNGGVVAYHLEGVFSSIRGFDDNGFAVFANVSDRAVDSVQAALAYFFDFDGGFFSPFRGVVSYNLRAFRESVKRVFCAGGSGLGAVNGGLGDEMKGVFGAVRGFDYDGFGRFINLGNRAMDGRDHSLIRARGQKEERSNGKQTKRMFEHRILHTSSDSEFE
jgi:hypothetical protein